MKKKLLKGLSVMLTAVLLLACVPLGGYTLVKANSWTIRSSLPNNNETAWKYYSSPLNTYPISPYNGGNCTWYAFGRAYEVYGVNSGLRPAGNAGNWYSYAQSIGLPVGSAPRAGSIICWSTHVGFVESVSGNSVTWTESAWGNDSSTYNFRCYTSTHPETYCSSYNGGVLQGYIYLDGLASPPISSYSTINTGTYYIKHNASGNYMNISWGADSNEQSIHTYPFGGYSSQQYELSGSDSYALRPLSSTSRVVNGYGNTISSGSKVCLWDNTGDSSQRWKFQKVSGGYIIHNAQNTNCVIDTDDNGYLYLYNYTGGSNQIWSIQNTITYDANGGTNAPAVQFKNYGETAYVSSAMPVRSGYVFKGWAKSSSATTATYSAGDAYAANENITLYAVWEKATSVSITTQPKTVYAKKGAYATTTVKASGEGLTYKWYVSDVGDTKYFLSSQTTNTYKLKMSEANHNRRAYCVVTDKYGNTTTSNIIRLRMEATITTQPTSVTAAKNAKAKFTVAASGVGLKYQWQVKTSSKAAWKNTTTTGYKTKTITVSATTARNGYQYRCVITDSAGNKVYSNAAKLTVKTPKITTQPTSVTAAKNAKAKFTVAASGVGLKYQWQVKTSSKAAWKNTTTTGYKTKTITVSATTARNGYQYRCVITDAAGNKVTSKAVKLTVKTPKITTQPTSVTAVKNAKAKFTVAASGVGLKYQWQVKTSSKAAWKNTTTTGYETKTITVSATTARNGYQYRCVITDAAGNKVTSKAVKLTVKK